MHLRTFEEEINSAFEPENAVAILEKFLHRPYARADGKSTMRAALDMALCRAIIALNMTNVNEKPEPELHDYEVTFYLTGGITIAATYPKLLYDKSQFLSGLCRDGFTLLDSRMCTVHIDNVLTNSDVLINLKNVMFMRVKEK